MQGYAPIQISIRTSKLEEELRIAQQTLRAEALDDAAGGEAVDFSLRGISRRP